MSIFTVAILSSVFCVTTSLINKEEGEKCKFVNDEEWTCKALSECPQIGDFRRSRPDICGFKGKEPIICCPPNSDDFLVETTTAKVLSEDVLSSNGSSDKTSGSSSSAVPIRGPPLAILKCIEYEVKLCQNNIMTDEKGDVRYLRDVSSTKNDSHGEVAGGQTVSLEQFPFMAVIGYGEEDSVAWECSGTVISEKWVLSAAHCAHSASGNARWVGVSGVKMNPDYLGAKMLITRTEVHPLYRAPAMYHDIALFQLEYNFGFNAFVRPVCLYPLKVLPRNAAATGWETNFFDGKRSSRLLYENMKTIDAETCENIHSNSSLLPRGIDNEIMFCAEGTKNNFCTSDSGGPLFYNSTICLHVQLGIASFGRNCGTYPDVYTKISYYLPWIEGIIWQGTDQTIPSLADKYVTM